MAPTTQWACNAVLKQWGTTAADRVDYVTDTIKIGLIDDTLTPDQDAHDYWSDLSANEAGTSQTLGSKTLTLTTATNTVTFDCADPEWTAPGTFRWGIIYKDTGVTTTSVILGIIDFEANQTSSGTFTLQVAADGLLEAVIS